MYIIIKLKKEIKIKYSRKLLEAQIRMYERERSEIDEKIRRLTEKLCKEETIE